MLTTLLNTTVIWLGSLLLYELLLKRETFHRLNRFYLLFTFAVGIVLPLLPWGGAVHFTVSNVDMLQASALSVEKDVLPTGSASSSTGLPQNTNWWLLLYATGVAVSILFLLTNLFKLWRLFCRATTCRQGQLLIAETGKEHGPFSFLHILFVCRQTDYTPQQWQMVVQHETAHYHRRHLFDLALLQIAQIVLWFHPLVYLYRNKLRLLHEYEVDALQEADIGDYGRFLVQQATVPRDYSLTHAFNFSPLKKRIQMLTKNPSTRSSKIRFLVLLPLISLSLWCCAQNGPKLAIDIKGEYAMRHDAVVKYPENPMKDTIEMLDPVTGKWNTVIMQKDPVPLTLNKQPIAKREELSSTPQCLLPGGEFGLEYLVEKAQVNTLLEQLPDGNYHMAISEIIVDSRGRIACYRLESPQSYLPSGGKNSFPDVNAPRPTELKDADKAQLQKQVSEVLLGKDIAFTPAKNKQGVASPYFLDFADFKSGFLLRSTFTVKDHKLSAFDYSL